MQELIKSMKELVSMLEAMEAYANGHEDEATPEEAMELGHAAEIAGDLLYGFITGNFEDDEVGKARKMLVFYGLD